MKIESKKETAIEFYEKELTKLLISLENNEMSIGVFAVKKFDLFGQAKQLEKQQITYAFLDGKLCAKTNNIDSEQYYNEQYGGENGK